MKKLVSVFLALALILSLSAVAFAAENSNATMSITGSDRVYNGYKLLNLTVSLKGEEHHPEGCDGNHTDECYNYAYSVNEKYRTILQRETFANAGASLWGANKPADASGVTDAQILEHLSKQSSDSGDTFGTLRSLADRVYLAIKTANIEPDAAGIKDTATISQGYWMFADVTNLGGENDANSLVMVDTKGESDITVAPKVAIPTVEKKVKDIEDSEDSNISDNPWHDSADHDIDTNPIPFKLTAAPPSNAAYYKTYKLIFHDTMSAGLTLNKNSFKVYIYDSKYKADVDTDIFNAGAPDQQPVGIDAVGCAGQQCTVVRAVNDAYVVDFVGSNNFDLIHLIGDGPVQNCNGKGVAQLHFIQFRKELGMGQAPVGGKYAVCILAAHRKRGPLQMAAGNIQHFRGNAVIHRQLHAQLLNSHIAHNAVSADVQDLVIALQLAIIQQRIFQLCQGNIIFLRCLEKGGIVLLFQRIQQRLVVFHRPGLGFAVPVLAH